VSKAWKADRGQALAKYVTAGSRSCTQVDGPYRSGRAGANLEAQADSRLGVAHGPNAAHLLPAILLLRFQG